MTGKQMLGVVAAGLSDLSLGLSMAFRRGQMEARFETLSPGRGGELLKEYDRGRRQLGLTDTEAERAVMWKECCGCETLEEKECCGCETLEEAVCDMWGLS